MTTKQDVVNKTSLMLVQHIRDCAKSGEFGRGVHSRIFSIILHPEKKFVAVGQSQEVIDGADIHPEHVVPCAVMIAEARKLIEDNVSDEDVAKLISRHWKIVYISKNQANYLDSKKGLNMKSAMPDGWCFMTGDSFARLREANIEIFPL